MLCYRNTLRSQASVKAVRQTCDEDESQGLSALFTMPRGAAPVSKVIVQKPSWISQFGSVTLSVTIIHHSCSLAAADSGISEAYFMDPTSLT